MILEILHDKINFKSKLFFLIYLIPSSIYSAEIPLNTSSMPWWMWPLILLIVTFIMGIIAVLGGVGGRSAICSNNWWVFFHFILIFVRGTGLLVALCGALAAGPGLLKSNLANLRLAMPMALIASTMAIVGAMGWTFSTFSSNRA